MRGGRRRPGGGALSGDLEHRVEELWSDLDPTRADAVEETIARLDRGELRVAEKQDGEWIVNEWVKKAILL